MADHVDGYLRAIRAMAPLVAEHRNAFDRERRLPEPVFEALADAGLFRLLLPRSLGGPELSPHEFMTIAEEAAALDGTIGWLVGNGGGMSRTGGYVSAEVGRAWFADPRAFVVSATGAVGTAVPVTGGYSVSGRWPFGSGAHHGTLFMGLASLAHDDASRLCCYISRADVTVHDNWHVSGLRGTGSCDFEAHDVYVPAEHTHPFLGHAPVEAGLLYRLPALSIFAWTISVVPLGMARGAITSFAELASRKSRLSTTALLRDRETVQATVGRDLALHHAARAFLADTMTELTAATDAGCAQRLVQARAAFRSACAFAAESAVGIVDRLTAATGSMAISESCPIERAMRDVRAAAQHIAMSPNNHIITGRMALGLDPGAARF